MRMIIVIIEDLVFAHRGPQRSLKNPNYNSKFQISAWVTVGIWVLVFKASSVALCVSSVALCGQKLIILQ
jgi:hypothetical protein